MSLRTVKFWLAFAFAAGGAWTNASAQWLDYSDVWTSYYSPSWTTSYYTPYTSYYGCSSCGLCYGGCGGGCRSCGLSYYSPSCGSCGYGCGSCSSCGYGCGSSCGGCSACGTCGSYGCSSCGYGSCGSCGCGSCGCGSCGCSSCGYSSYGCSSCGSCGGLCSAAGCSGGNCSSGSCSSGNCAADTPGTWKSNPQPTPDTGRSRPSSDYVEPPPAGRDAPAPSGSTRPMRTFDDPDYDRTRPSTGNTSAPMTPDSNFKPSNDRLRPRDDNPLPMNRDSRKPAVEDLQPIPQKKEDESSRQYDSEKPGTKSSPRGPSLTPTQRDVAAVVANSRTATATPMLKLDTVVTWRSVPEATRVRVRTAVSVPTVARNTVETRSADPNADWTAVGGATKLVRK